jgi:hypothetical protein
MARAFLDTGKTGRVVAKAFGIPETTLYRALGNAGGVA